MTPERLKELRSIIAQKGFITVDDELELCNAVGRLQAELAAYREIGTLPLVRDVVAEADYWDYRRYWGNRRDEKLRQAVQRLVDSKQPSPTVPLSADDAQTVNAAFAIMKRYMPEEPR